MPWRLVSEETLKPKAQGHENPFDLGQLIILPGQPPLCGHSRLVHLSSPLWT